jgi:hypothetical protein
MFTEYHIILNIHLIYRPTALHHNKTPLIVPRNHGVSIEKEISFNYNNFNEIQQ